MNLQTIQEKLNIEFSNSNRKLIFWYDDNADFSEEIDSLELKNAKIHKLTGDNSLYTKYFLECEDKENSYLIYAPFPKPADKDNHLSDMVYYSKQFFADRVSLLCADLKIPEKFKEHLARFSKFWKSNERVEKFAALNIENYNQSSIDIGLLAVMTGVKTPSFEEILKSVIITDNYVENKYIAAIDKVGLLPAFWELCEKLYGYKDENPTLEKLIVTLLVTYTAHDFKGELPKPYQAFISYKKNDVSVFISNLMNNILYKDGFDVIASKIGTKMKLSQYLKDIPVGIYFDCDAFEEFDKMIIAHISKVITESSEPLNKEYKDVISKRATKTHFASKFKSYYRALEKADNLISALQEFGVEAIKDANEVISKYINKWSRCDMLYRQFYEAYDSVSDNEVLQETRNLIENIYSNSFLLKLSVLWSEKLENVTSYGQLDGLKQHEFYNRVVSPAVRKECTVVIISDALRYECGQELHSKLSDKAGVNSELSYMLSVLPSFTRLGMAALLPHKAISFTNGYDVLVDDASCVSSIEREKILASYNPNAAIISYTDILAMNRETVRKFLTGKELIYVYHNQIDARGDHSATEQEVFIASNEAINEIMVLIQKLTVDRSITNYIVTADHGYLYKRDKLDESDKVNLIKQSGVMLNKRFVISRDKLDIEGTLTYNLEYLSEQCKDIFVTVPRGVDIFKAPGGGQNYVHGGASLQEIIIPLIKVKTERGKKDVTSVSVVLTSLSRKITNLITYLDFIQTENVSDILKASKLKVYFESESGEKISDEEIIVADKKNASPEKRQYREKFIFKNRKYTKNEKYYLVMIDMEAEMEISRHEFILDIAFANDFDF